MLNSIKAGNKKEFMDIVIRLHMAMGKDVSPIFIETMQTTGLDFESIGHSFLAGLISNKYEKKEEEKIRWHTPRGDSMINYTEFGDLASIMSQNYELFEVHIVSIDWARQIFQTIERSRNVIMHSGELGRRDIERIGTNIRDWINQVG